MKVSILMLTHNAPVYTLRSIVGVRKTVSVEYELIVVDNRSKALTRFLVKAFRRVGLIDVLYLNETNALFAQGNNIASHFASDDSTHYCLLNSDIRINN